MSDEDLIKSRLTASLANIIADRALDRLRSRLDGLSGDDANKLIEAAVEEEFRRCKRAYQLNSELHAIEEQQRFMAALYPMDWSDSDEEDHHSTLVNTTSETTVETTVEFTLPPLKPIPKVDQAEIDAINRRVSDPSEQDRLAKEFMEQYVKRRKDG